MTIENKLVEIIKQGLAFKESNDSEKGSYDIPFIIKKLGIKTKKDLVKVYRYLYPDLSNLSYYHLEKMISEEDLQALQANKNLNLNTSNVTTFRKIRQLGLKRFGYTEEEIYQQPFNKDKILYYYTEVLKLNSLKFSIGHTLIHEGLAYYYDLLVENKYLVKFNISSQVNYSIGSSISIDHNYKHQYVASLFDFHYIGVWDWDIPNRVVGLMIKPSNIIKAEETELREVEYPIANRFLENNYNLGSCRGQDIRYGLYYQGELVMVMSLSKKKRFNSRYEYELLRQTEKIGWSIEGGLEKIFNHFLKQYNPESVVTYIDSSKYDSKDLIQKLNFKVIDTQIGLTWYHPILGLNVRQSLLSKRGYNATLGYKFNNIDDRKVNIGNRMIENGFLKIYDASQQTLLWYRDNGNN